MLLLHKSNSAKDSNSLAWRNPIEVRNSVAIDFLNLGSFREVQSTRDRLKQADLIDFRTLSGSKIVTYSIYDVETKSFAPIAKVMSKVEAKVEAKVLLGVDAEVVKNTNVLYKPKPKPKEREPTQKLKPVAEKYDLEFFEKQGHVWNIPEPLRTRFNEFLIYRCDRNEPIRNYQSIEAILKEFFTRKLTAEQGVEVIDFTISRDAKNLIFDKGKTQNNERKNESDQKHGRISASAIEAYLNGGD